VSNKRITGVLDHSQTRGTARLLMVILADRADDDGFCWPGRDDIARRANVSASNNVSRILQQACDLRELYIHERPGYVNQYLVLPGQSLDDIQAAFDRRFSIPQESTEQWLTGQYDLVLNSEGGIKLIPLARGRESATGGSRIRDGRGRESATGGVANPRHEPLLNPHITQKNQELALSLWESILEHAIPAAPARQVFRQKFPVEPCLLEGEEGERKLLLQVASPVHADELTARLGLYAAQYLQGRFPDKNVRANFAAKVPA